MDIVAPFPVRTIPVVQVIRFTSAGLLLEMSVTSPYIVRREAQGN
jgi:hypothetical protein